jgi:hypothetical protein
MVGRKGDRVNLLEVIKPLPKVMAGWIFLTALSDGPQLKDFVGELLGGSISRKTLLGSSGRGMRAPTRGQTNPGDIIPQTQS